MAAIHHQTVDFGRLANVPCFLPPYTGMKRSAVLLTLALLPHLLAAHLTFHAAILDAGSRMEAARNQFLQLLAPFQDDRTGDITALQASYANYLHAVSFAHTVATPSSSEFLELRRAFLILLASEDAERNDLGSIVDKIRASHGRLDLVARLNLSGSLNRCEGSEAAALKRFLATAAAVSVPK
jgi:hypothetical protein